MKIAIMSFPGSPSHGASLQMYALYRTIEKMGHTPVILNYIPKKLADQYNFTGKKTLKYYVTNSISKLLVPNTKKAFSDFESGWQKVPEQVLTDKTKLTKLTENIDKIIVGSDQVWNMDITFHDYSFFLDFCNDKKKKVAYAPSFGNDNVYDEERIRIGELLSEFSYLSAREKRGCELIKELTGKQVPMVCDPTFLLDENEWREISRRFKYKNKYVLLYTIKPSIDLYKKAIKFAKKHNMEIVIIGGKLRNYFCGKEKHVFGVGPAEFLGLVDNAEYIFTNSFHGTAFSIIFNKNFYVEYSSNTNIRLVNLIEITGLTQCIVKKDCDTINEYEFIDYKKVKNELQKVIEVLKSYLGRMLTKDE